MNKFPWILLFVLVFSACFRPNYQQQYVETPESWRLETDEGSTLCNYSWWQQFEDPVLDQLILIALQNNEDLHVAIARVFEYCARLGVANADLYPTITGTGIYSRGESSIAVPISVPPGINRTDNNFELYISGTWELDLWGRIRSATEAAYADLLGQIEARRGVVITVVSSVANAYIILRQLDAQLEISKKTLETRLESLKLAQVRFELGETSEIEVTQAASEVEVAAIRVIEFERAIPQQENLISILIGINPRSIERGTEIAAFEYPITIPAGLPSDLLERRPDIVQAEDQLIAANARVSQAKALFFPQITLTGMYGSQSNDLSLFLTNPAEMWDYGVTAVQTIFDAGRIAYGVEVAEAIRDQALFNYRQKILNAFREVEDGLIAYQKNKQLVEEHKKQVKILGQYLHLAQLRYEEGEIDYLNVLDAERSLFDAQLQLAQSQAESFMAVVSIYSALGGGWVYDADAAAIGNMLLNRNCTE